MTLELTPAEPVHAPLWHRWRAEGMTQRYNAYASHDVSVLAERLAACGSDLKNEDCTHFRWFVRAGKQWVGNVALTDVSWAMRHASIGYQIADEYAGRGYGTQAVTQLIDRAFGESRLVRLMALIDADNIASQRLVARLGFCHEGVLRSHVELNDNRRDQWVYGLLREEWMPQRSSGKRRGKQV